MTIHAGSSIGSQRCKEWMALRVHGARRIEYAERSVVAIKRVELGQCRAAAGLNPRDLETVLVLRAQNRVRFLEDEGDQKSKVCA